MTPAGEYFNLSLRDPTIDSDMESRDGEVFLDRLEALHEGGANVLEPLLRRHPVIASAVNGEGPLGGRIGRRYTTKSPIGDLTEMARLLARPLVIDISVNCATRTEQQLLALATWNGGSLDRDETIAVTEASPDVLDRAARGVAESFLADLNKGWLVLRPGVAERVWLPGQPFRRVADNFQSPQLETMLKNLGVPAPLRKWERVEAMETALRDRNVIERTVAGLEPDERSLFGRLLRAGRVVDLDEWDLPSQHLYGANPVIARLSSTGLIGHSRWERLAWVWLDVLVALADGKMFHDWTEPDGETRSIADTGTPRVPAAVGRLDRVLDQWATSSPKALKSGGLGVRPIRATAKTLGMSSTEVGLLASLAIELGLLAPVVTSRKGRGRNQTVEEEWRPTDSRETWRDDTTWRRWARMVQQWLDTGQLEVTGKAIERFEHTTPEIAAPLVRAAFIQVLADMADGDGLALSDLKARLVFDRYGLITPEMVEQLVSEARVLGLVPGDDPVGLTTAARLLLAGVEKFEELAQDGSRQFTVQADHTIIAPPDLDPDVLATLERFTRVESEAGALIYRITTEEVVRALDSGWTAGKILTFLADGSSVPVAQNVERTITDAADRHGRLTVGSTTTWVTCNDPVLLANAVAVKPAKLVAVTPTLAVSELSQEKVLAVLRAKGLAPGEHGTDEPTEEAPTPGYLRVTELRERPLPTSEDIAAMSARVMRDRPGETVHHDQEAGLIDVIERSGGEA